MKVNALQNITKIIVKTILVDTKNNIVGITKNRVSLKKANVLSVEEQKSIVSIVKKDKHPKKCICSGILENQVAFLTDGETRQFDFDEIELTYEDLNSLENDNCTHLCTFEHRRLKPINFKPTPLLLSDLNEIVVVLREVTTTQIKTRKNRMMKKGASPNTLTRGATRKHYSKTA